MDLLPEVHGILLAMGIMMTPEVIDRCTKLEIIGQTANGTNGNQSFDFKRVKKDAGKEKDDRDVWMLDHE